MNYRPMRAQEAEEVCALVRKVFRGFVAPLYGPEGVSEFEGYAEPEKLLARWREGNPVLVAEAGGGLKGMIEIRDQNHIALFFVDREVQRKGIGRALLAQALEACRDREPGLDRLTVYSAPNSVDAYRRLGFNPTGPQQARNGITFVPLELNLTLDRAGENGLPPAAPRDQGRTV